MHYDQIGSDTYRLHLKKNSPVTLTSTFDDGPDILLKVMEEDTSGFSYGHIWSIAEGIVKSGIDLVGWSGYFESLKSDYDHLLAGEPYYRDIGVCTEKERKTIMWQRHDLRRKLDEKRYLPADVVMPNFIEGPAAKPSIFRNLAEATGLDVDIVHEYFLKSFASQQVSAGKITIYSDCCWESMVDANLVVSGADIPVEAAISTLSLTEARSALLSAGFPTERTKAGSVLALRRIPECYLKPVIQQLKDWDGVFCVLPPDGLDWQDFQSVRQQVKGMAVALADLYGGHLPKKDLRDLYSISG